MRREDLPELGVVKTATPCNVSWESMSGDDVKRYCGKCKLHVWNFSELTTDQARALLVETQGRLCGRIFTRADGTVLTKDCPTGVAVQRRKKVGGIAAAAALLGGAAAALVSGNAPGVTTMGGLAPTPAAPIITGNERGMMVGQLAVMPPPPPPLVSGNSPGTELRGKIRLAPPAKNPKR